LSLLRTLPLTRAAYLDPFHRDTADQIIVATATLVIETGSIHGGRVSEACLVPATRRTDRVTVAEVARIGEMHSGADAE
jgi:hypothetical protein